MTAVGSTTTRLIVLRGPSGSGKTSTAAGLRERRGRGLALVELDYLRRRVLRERDVEGGANIALLDQVARFSLDHGYDVVVEGILAAERYGAMLTRLHDDHRGTSAFYFFDVSLEESLRRHTTRPQAAEFGPEHMRGWYLERDLLPGVDERIVPETSSLEATIERITHEMFPEHEHLPA
ncbi:AAA family ATPase [Amycolatopsis sp. NPDC004378]